MRVWLVCALFGAGMMLPWCAGDRNLELALGTAAWLTSTAECKLLNSTTCCAWPMNSTDGAPQAFPYIKDALYYGPSGVALFLAQATEAAPQPTIKAQLTQLTASALDQTVTTLPALLKAFGPNIGLYYGLAGIAFGLRTAGSGLPREHTYVHAAMQIESHILSIAPFSSEHGAPLWNNTDIAHGAAGAGLYLLHAADRSSPKHAALLQEAALRAGKWLLNVAEKASVGVRWWRGPDTDGTHTNQYFPTFCCGTAGVGYFLSQLAKVDNNTVTAAAARQAAEHVLATAVQKDGNLVVPHEEEGSGEQQYYMGWCGGAAGWSRLFVAMWEQTKEQKWIDAIEKAVHGVIALALPHSAMFVPTPAGQPVWANLGQCCGVAGVGTFLLQVGSSELPIDPHVKTAAIEAAQQFSTRLDAGVVTTSDGENTFASPEEHAAPLNTRWQAGWMQGSAGMASFLLHVRAVTANTSVGARIPLPDEPWKRFDPSRNFDY